MRKKILKKDKKIEFEEILLDSFSQKKTPLFDFKKMEKPLVGKNVYFAFGIIFFLLSFLFLRTFYLQIIKHQYYSELAKKNFQKTELIRPVRGIIYDRKLKPLLANRTVFDLVFEKENDSLQKDRNLDEEIYIVSSILGQSPQLIKEKIENSFGTRILVYQNLDKDQLIELKAKSDSLSYFKIEQNFIRDYYDPLIFSHILGYTNKITKEEYQNLKNYDIADIIGREGLEKNYEEVLRGKPGLLVIQRDAFLKEIKKEIFQEPESGNSLVLYLDSRLQKRNYEIFETILKKLNLKKGGLIMLDVKTGGVLSLLSFPSYDNNLFGISQKNKEIEKIFNDPDSPLLNRIVAGYYPPGSTIKPFIALGALQENIINPQGIINCPGYIVVPNPWGKPTVFQDWRTHGIVNLKKAIAQSCDVYFWKVGEKMGVSKIKKYLESFGFDKQTKIDLPSEKNGFLPDPEWKKNNLKDDWRIGDTYNISIGQGYLRVTPLEIAQATLSLVNNGKVLRPRIVKEIIDEKKNIIKEFEPEVLDQLNYNAGNFELIKEGMKETTISGTASSLRFLPISCGAKTGTAQTNKKNFYNYWITVFAPYQDPEVVLTIVLEDVSLPFNPSIQIASEILFYYFSEYKNIEK